MVAHAVKFSRYEGPEVLEIVEMTTPAPGVGEVVVEVMAAGLNPGETSIREGRFAREWPARFPAGQGSDFAGFIVRIGSGVTGWDLNDAVLGTASLPSFDRQRQRQRKPTGRAPSNRASAR